MRERFAAMNDAGEVPAGAEADVKEGDALALPFADGEFDRIVAAEVLEHIHADVDAIKELVRVLRPGGTLAISVPRWLPEIVNWKLSDDYHNAEGGHIRIYTDEELVDKVTKAGRSNDGTPGDAMVFTGKDYAHGLHAPYWWIKCAVGVTNDDHPLAKAYHQLLVWEIMKHPKALQFAGKVLDPLIGKSMVLYFRKPGDDAAVRHAATWPRSRRPRPRSRRCRSRPARSRGRPASTPTSGTTSSRRWRCSSAGRSRPPSAPTPGRSPRSAPTARGR